MTKNTQHFEVESEIDVQSRFSEQQVETATPVQEKDEFATTEYLDPDARLPRIQALRGKTAKTCGYFVAVNQMAGAGWKDFDKNNSSPIHSSLLVLKIWVYLSLTLEC